MINIILKILNIITSGTVKKNSSLKKRVFGNYEFFTKTQYHYFMTISCITDILLGIFMYRSLMHLNWIFYINKISNNTVPTFSSQLKIYFTILGLLLAIIFITFIIYNLLFYPRAYRKYEQPECVYYDGNSYRKGFIVNISKNEAFAFN